MTPALDAEHQTQAVSSTPRPQERTGEQYIMGHARRGWYAKRRRVPATRSGHGVAYAVAAWFRLQGYQVVRRTRRVPPSLHAIADRYREEILTLRGLPDPEGPCCSYQFWLSVSCHGWRVFEVMKGGIREITRDI